MSPLGRIFIAVDPRPLTVAEDSDVAVLAGHEEDVAVSIVWVSFLGVKHGFSLLCLLDEVHEVPVTQVDDLARHVDVCVHDHDLVVARHVVLVSQQWVVSDPLSANRLLRRNVSINCLIILGKVESTTIERLL